METKFVRDFLRDLYLILEADEQHFVRYDEKNNEILTNLMGDTIYYFDTNDKDDMTKLTNYILHYMSEHGKELAIKNRNINIETR